MQADLSHRRPRPASVSVLLSEGSSLTARQAITALGLRGYRIDVCDADPFCIGRFSRFVRRFYRSPAWADHPDDYLEFIRGRLEQGRYDVLLPVHEQAFLFAAAKDRLEPLAGIALTEFAHYAVLQSKANFARLIDRLGLPHPPTWLIRNQSQLEAMDDFPHYVKAPYSTAGSGVWLVENAADRSEAVNGLRKQGLLGGGTDIVVQDVATGVLSQAQAVFEQGRLIAVHCTSQEAEGVGGSQSARLSVDHPIVRTHLETLGRYLGWHGALALDYLFDPVTGKPSYIEANPRLVEPMNGVISGVNLADILVRLSLGESFSRAPLGIGRFGIRSHSLAATLLGIAGRGGSRLQLVKEAAKAVFKRGIYQKSREDLTPIVSDWQSLIPLTLVGLQLLINPDRARQIADHAVSAYALKQETVEKIYRFLDLPSEP